MIILPERGLPKGRILLPQRPHEWRQPSQRSSIYGSQNSRYWRLTARTDDGHIIWRGWFEDREDADAFLYSLISGSLYYEKDLWRLPTPWWPGLDPSLVYDFASLRFITSGSNSNQTDTVDSDWNSTNNHIDVIASGGGGAVTIDAVPATSATGGGGGAWSRQTNVVLTPGGSATFFQQQGTGVSTGAGSTNGKPGFDGWYNGATLAASSVGAKCGNGGNAGVPPLAGGAGGLASGGIGSTKYNGGNGGAANDRNIGTGGGGAAGPNGDGGQGGDSSTFVSATDGGTGGAGYGGFGGAGATNALPGSGSGGTEYQTLPFNRGSGGGGGGAASSGGGTFNSGSAGVFGGGSGGCSGRVGFAVAQSGEAPLIVLVSNPVFNAYEDSPQIPYRNLSKIKMVGY